MGDRIAVMRQGAPAGGDARRSSTQPTNVFVGRFIGSPAMNVVPATFMEGAGLSGQLAGFRPEHARSATARGASTSPRDVEVVEYLGDEQLVHLAAARPLAGEAARGSSSWRGQEQQVLHRPRQAASLRRGHRAGPDLSLRAEAPAGEADARMLGRATVRLDRDVDRLVVPGAGQRQVETRSSRPG